MAKLYILCGYPFAGKSTIAKALIERYGFVRIALDEIKSEFEGDDLQKAYDTYRDRIIFNLKAGRNVITDTVAHTRESRNGLKKIAADCDADPVILFIDTPIDVVKDRWMQNRVKKERVDVTDEEFNYVTSNFEVPEKEKNVITVSNDMKIEEIYRLIEA
jgi:predicted kinase